MAIGEATSADPPSARGPRRLIAALLLLAIAAMGLVAWELESDSALLDAARQQAAKTGRNLTDLRRWAIVTNGRFGNAAAVDLFFGPPNQQAARDGFGEDLAD